MTNHEYLMALAAGWAPQDLSDEEPEVTPEPEPTVPAEDWCLITGALCSRRQPMPGRGAGCPCLKCVTWGVRAKETECQF